MSKNCIVCNGTFTTEQVFAAWDYKLDRKVCQVHIDEICELILKQRD